MRKLNVFVLLFFIHGEYAFGCMKTPIASEEIDIPISRGSPGVNPGGTPGSGPAGPCSACPPLSTSTLMNLCTPNVIPCNANNIIMVSCPSPCVVYSQKGGPASYFFSSGESVRCDASGNYFIETTQILPSGVGCTF